MSDNVLTALEIAFNLAYLIAIWSLVVAMWRRLPKLSPADRPLARLFIWAFFLLALGDTGHVGFRVLAYALGGLDASLHVLGRQLGLVGLGALSTAVTVTLFYVFILMIWQKRFGKSYGWFGLLLFLSAAVRLLLMIPSQNQWNSVVPPTPWSLYRNLPLIIQGLGVAYLILRDAIPDQDNTFKWVGIFILVSYAFYMPVIFFVQQYPAIGMLMIPKTLAYVAIAVLAYKQLFIPRSPSEVNTIPLK